MAKFLIVRLGSLGDIVHALPVAAALRDAYPLARIDWLVDARNRAILDLVPAIDRRLTVGDPAGAGILQTIRALRAERYDAAIDLQGLLKSAVLARSSGAARVIGFATPRLRERTARPFYTETVDPGEGIHVVRKNLALLAPLGIRANGVRFPLELPPTAIVGAVRDRLGLSGTEAFALLNPGAAWPNKRWPPARFGAIASWLRDRQRLKSAVLWGPGDEALAREAAEASAGAAAPAPATSIADLVALARAAALMVSGDTGPLHIAAAVGTPIVGLFGPTDPARNGPWAPGDLTISRFDACVCHHKRRCRRDRPCLLDIAVDEVLGAIDRRLAHHG